MNMRVTPQLWRGDFAELEGIKGAGDALMPARKDSALKGKSEFSQVLELGEVGFEDARNGKAGTLAGFIWGVELPPWRET
jgi:hypothetical protein